MIFDLPATEKLNLLVSGVDELMNAIYGNFESDRVQLERHLQEYPLFTGQLRETAREEAEPTGVGAEVRLSIADAT
jgi:hypothetical protein